MMWLGIALYIVLFIVGMALIKASRLKIYRAKDGTYIEHRGHTIKFEPKDLK